MNQLYLHCIRRSISVSPKRLVFTTGTENGFQQIVWLKNRFKYDLYDQNPIRLFVFCASNFRKNLKKKTWQQRDYLKEYILHTVYRCNRLLKTFSTFLEYDVLYKAPSKSCQRAKREDIVPGRVSFYHFFFLQDFKLIVNHLSLKLLLGIL